MTKEQKELLLKDLCARLPYGVKIETEYFTKATLIAIRKNISYGACKDLLVTYDISNEETPYQSEERSSTISKIKPYLFPLSSMTEEQKREFDISMDMGYAAAYNAEINCANRMIDFFNKYHLDYRGLIPMGLAIDATNKNIY